MSNFKPRNLLLVFALALAIALLATIFMQRRPESQLQSVVKALPKGIDVALQDIDYTHVEDGVARWRMIARQVERQADSGIFVVKRPELSFFDEQGEVVGTMHAGEGTVSENYQNVRLVKDVELKDAAGYSIYTDQLQYDHPKQLAVTDNHVRIEAQGLSLQGKGMSFDIQRKTLELNADVKGVFKPR